ncbi:hypothetical protein MDA_GLEAN10012073 [Myotis davidii]|uniref:Uncharacterized protein n=1 Tax=Myotis davidii TaxID=225400 RepID=L5MFV2_MYODS|nr:hypothetical protein MDA_GLEAN10012073 [Myotis davidii]
MSSDQAQAQEEPATEVHALDLNRTWGPSVHRPMLNPLSQTRKADCHVQRLIWMCLESWKLDYPTFSYKWTLRACLEVLAGEHSYSYTLDRRPVFSSGGKVVLFHQVGSFGRDADGSVREEGDTRLARQINRIIPGDQ